MTSKLSHDDLIELRELTARNQRRPTEDELQAIEDGRRKKALVDTILNGGSSPLASIIAPSRDRPLTRKVQFSEIAALIDATPEGCEWWKADSEKDFVDVCLELHKNGFPVQRVVELMEKMYNE